MEIKRVFVIALLLNDTWALHVHQQAGSQDLFNYLGKFGEKISNLQYLAFMKN